MLMPRHVWVGIAGLAIGVAAGAVVAAKFLEAQNVVTPQLKAFEISGPPGSRVLAFSGVWAIEGERPFQIEQSTFYCYESGAYCVEGSGLLYKSQLRTEVNSYSGVTWTEDTVTIDQTAGPAGALACRTSELVATLPTREVVRITRDTPDRTESCPFPALEKPRISRLVSGDEWVERYR